MGSFSALVLVVMGRVTSLRQEREGRISLMVRTAWISCSQSRAARMSGSACRLVAPSWAAGQLTWTCNAHVCPPCCGYTCRTLVKKPRSAEPQCIMGSHGIKLLSAVRSLLWNDIAWLIFGTPKKKWLWVSALAAQGNHKTEDQTETTKIKC